jgi:hypothetical protein
MSVPASFPWRVHARLLVQYDATRAHSRYIPIRIAKMFTGTLIITRCNADLSKDYLGITSDHVLTLNNAASEGLIHPRVWDQQTLASILPGANLKPRV